MEAPLVGYQSDSDSQASSSSSPPPPPRRQDDRQVEDHLRDAFQLKALSSSHNQPVDDVDPNQPSPKRRKATGQPKSSSASASIGLTDPSASSQPQTVASPSTSLTVSAAPDVISNDASSNALLARPSDTQMLVNIPYKDMTAPILGPQNPFSKSKLGGNQNTLSGHVEGAAISDFDFRNQQRTFEAHGYARNPSLLGSGSSSGSRPPRAWVGDIRAMRASGGITSVEIRGGDSKVRATAKDLKKKRKGQNGDASIVEGEGAYVGPWGGWEGENVHVADGVGPTEEEIKAAEEKSTNRKKEKEAMEEKRQREEAQGTEKSIFHGKSMYDYQGRTYMHIPTDVDTNLHGEPGSEDSFLPKSCIHTWTGHTKGISAVRLFPKSGHLLLSASMDTKIKLWDVYHEGNCLRTFMGHSKAVKDITFSNDGRRFLSAGYDRQMKLWDTETGACLKAFSNGMSDKKIIQYDMNTNEIIQEYDQHLGPVNTITFVDENRRFVTTSDDKTMRAWDYDIPVVIKYIADPLMHSMPAVSVHPNSESVGTHSPPEIKCSPFSSIPPPPHTEKWLACQSLDNQIVVYSSDSFRQNRKKIFKGHQVAGFACQVGFSPDGRFLSSGDGEGNLVFWDWKSARLLKRIRAHKEVVISHEWLPHESSKLVTGSWDGLIKLWD
ncbi:WD40 repeat-like protein [Violaceomyces palustris]|uniref:WD40 repeat-like protein n=1 Tax=Violaceomyces palustris TaxID=1673888 RepID=A0ACD0NWR5_9BASI|nr:WD40 repeat-like protein [Violaceomyces palustris]